MDSFPVFLVIFRFSSDLALAVPDCFLDDFYEAIKRNTIENTARTIAANIENDDLATFA